MKRRVRKMLLALLVVLLSLGVGVFAYLQHPRFGRLPQGERLARIEQSPNYVDGDFQNIDPIVRITQNKSMITAWAEFLFKKRERVTPDEPIPAVKTDLASLDPETDLIIWLGHSSYYLQLAGKRILIDPVFSAYASPIFFVNKAFAGTSLYNPEDMPEIDYLLLSHDHWDHLDYDTVSALRPKVKRVITPLGVGEHFERWGYAPEDIHEGDWYSSLQEEYLTFHILPARHFSGRLLTRNKTLWASFAIEAPGFQMFFSGDSGYGSHFAEIGSRFDGFDLVMLDAGQYDEEWRNVHMMPEDAIQAAQDLGAKNYLPAHSGKFTIAYHAWDDPFIRLAEGARDQDFSLLTPRIGEPVYLDGRAQSFAHWWEGPATAFSASAE